eukprot:5726866-Ditylum_brightwellii.AAC.1
MASLIEESLDVPQPILDVILHALISSENPHAHHLSAELVRQTEEFVHTPIQKFLTSAISGDS